jgi:hypothetical protein
VRGRAGDETNYHRLAGLDPLGLYIAGLRSILKAYEAVPSLRECFAPLEATMLEERGWLEETHEWPHYPKDLEQLMAGN